MRNGPVEDEETEHGASDARQLGGPVVLVMLGNLFTLAVGLPFQIYVARTLGAGELGVFSLLEGGVGIVAGLLSLGIAGTAVKFIPAHLATGEYGSVRSLVRGGAWLLLLVGSAAVVLALLITPWIVDRWPDLASREALIAWMSLMIPIGLLTYFFQQGLRGFHEIRYMVIGSSFLQLSLKVLLTVTMFAFGYRLFGYVAAVVVSSAMAMSWMYLGLRRKVHALPQRDLAPGGDATRQWSRFAAIMYGNSLIGSATGYLDRFLLGFFAGASPVGVLAIVKQLQQLPAVFLQMFLIVVAPMFSAAHAKDDRAQARHLFHLATDWIVRAALPLLIFLAIFAEPLLGLFGDEFARSGRIALWITVGAQAVNVACGPVGSLMNMTGHEAMIFRLGLYTAALSAVLCFVLIPSLGLTGAAIAIATGMVFHNLAAIVLARKYLQLRWWNSRFRRWLVPGILTLGLALTVFFFSDQRPSTVTMALTLVAAYGVFFGTSLARGLNPDDRALIGHLRARLLPRGPS